ncbi:MAG: DNA primase, partial [Chloroflexi bacterium]|nr:DNA primase [Chloroflexota bacterium]
MTVADDIKSRVDIVALVSETTPLKRAGRNFSANCPFHNERTPSFYVFPDRQNWRCFGACATGGDVFNFLMKKENVGFGEALRMLAERAGVTLESSQASKEKAQKGERLKTINKVAALFFHDLLLKDAEARHALEYVKGRGIDDATIEEFRLGYCPANRGALTQRLLAEGFSQEEALEAGLLRRRDDGTIYTLFRGRLIIPIQDDRTDYIAFGARTLEKDDTGPKYINSPQSPVFEKGTVLYGIHRAKEAIRKEGLAVIVEGYMDVITAHQYGHR